MNTNTINSTKLLPIYSGEVYTSTQSDSDGVINNNEHQYNKLNQAITYIQWWSTVYTSTMYSVYIHVHNNNDSITILYISIVDIIIHCKNKIVKILI